MAELLAKRPRVEPKIYAYEIRTPKFQGLLKVGITTHTVASRVEQQLANIKMPFKPDYYHIAYEDSAMLADGGAFSDKTVHDILKTMSGVTHVEGEWFRCKVRDVKAAVVAARHGLQTATQHTEDFGMRPEQAAAVQKTMDYYLHEAKHNAHVTPKFLWNAKMRFGKTFASYQLAKKMGFKRVLILTFKPAVLHSWRSDLESHLDFEGWQFLARQEGGGPDLEQQYARAKKKQPLVCFGSFQDFMGLDSMGNIKAHHEWIREINWDLVIFDEYHFGAWREKAKALFLDDNEEEDEDLSGYTRADAVDENYLPITARHYLFLSGTPFRALNEGEFIESQIFSWTYSDEQRAKETWQGKNNPYAALPQMVLLTYQIPERLRRVALQGDQNEFDLNTFFSTKGSGEQATFVFEKEVQSWLDFIRGHYFERDSDLTAMSGANYRPPQPYGDVRLRDVLQHTVWYMPNVAACFAMEKLLKAPRNTFYHDYEPVVCAGSQAGIGAKALPPVQKAMLDPLNTRSITLTCGKLTTGVTVKPWSGIFMLRNLKSPETYFQAAFRVQSPWTIKNDEGETLILKPTCYVFDFAPNRALTQVAQYSQKLSLQNEVAPGREQTPEEKVGEFIHFLPILHYDGTTMRQISAGEILDITFAGTSATLLAKRWESALLVNVDNDTLYRLKDNEAAMEALMRIEAFRALGNNVIETILAKTEEIKSVKKERPPKTQKEKREVDEKEKEVKSLRKQVQEKLVKFATRIPIFMYLTDYREHTLKEVISQIETDLFERVTGLTLKDFELLVSIGLFNNSLMNDAVLNFKRYEDASLSYTGIDKHQGETYRGAWDTRVRATEIFVSQETDGVEPAKVYLPKEPPRVVSQPTPSPRPPVVSPKLQVTPTPVRPKPQPTLPPVQPKAPAPFVPQPGMKVTHKVYGQGIVTRLEKSNGYLYVEFKGKEKAFSYPHIMKTGILSFAKSM